PVSGGPNDTSVGEISVKTGNNARNGGKNSLNRLIRCVCGKKIGPDPRNFNQRVSLGRNDLLIRTFPKTFSSNTLIGGLGSVSIVFPSFRNLLRSASVNLSFKPFIKFAKSGNKLFNTNPVLIADLIKSSWSPL
ncbi:hypothetical protein, partial [Escherichia coli]|uniref:hypothetical protein n=1 Tax=Escherichia coli TaxID=562 RepID=UPI0022822E2A